jgi:hypothetical protein
MKTGVKIATISAAVLAVAVGLLFIVIPFATTKTTEARLAEALAEAGIPEDLWSIGRAYYVPLLGHLVIEKLQFGEKGGDAFLEAKKVTLVIDTDNEDIFSGSVDAEGLSLIADNIGITAKIFSVKNFSVDKALLEYSPIEAIKKLGSIDLSDAVFTQDGQRYFSLKTFNADLGFSEGKIPFSSSISLKDFVVDVRQFAPLPALRREYRLSNFEINNSISRDKFTAKLAVDGANLFTLTSDLGISLPRELLATGNINDFA